MIVNVYKPEDLAHNRTRAGAFLVDAGLISLVSIPLLLVLPFAAPYILLAVSLLYEHCMLCFGGATLGHRLLNIRVVSIDQENLSYWQALSRTIVKQFSILPMGMGLFMPASLDQHRQGWHDALAGTLVIRNEAEPVGTSDSLKESVAHPAAIVGLVMAGLVACVIIVALMHAASALMSEYRLAQTYLEESNLVQSRLGVPLRTSFVRFDFKNDPGPSTTFFRMIVSGPDSSLIADMTLQKHDSDWRVVQVKYYDRSGHVVDLMKPMRDASDKLERLAIGGLDHQRLDSALFFADSALSIDSNNVKAIGTRASVLWLKGDLNNAIYEMTRALMKEPRKHDIRLQRGLAYIDAGKYRYALEDFDLLLKAQQYSPVAYKGKAVALDSLGRTEEAVMAYVDYISGELDTAKVQKDSAQARLTYLRSQLPEAKK